MKLKLSANLESDRGEERRLKREALLLELNEAKLLQFLSLLEETVVAAETAEEEKVANIFSPMEETEP